MMLSIACVHGLTDCPLSDRTAKPLAISMLPGVYTGFSVVLLLKLPSPLVVHNRSVAKLCVAAERTYVSVSQITASVPASTSDYSPSGSS